MKHLHKNQKHQIFCCSCNNNVNARLTNGAEVYPLRDDLHHLPFWKCDKCNNFVGCHHKTKNNTKPLGNIPSPQLKKARQKIHELLDPLWKSKKINRSKLYKRISSYCGYKYHTAEIKTIIEARKIYKIVLFISRDL